MLDRVTTNVVGIRRCSCSGSGGAARFVGTGPGWLTGPRLGCGMINPVDPAVIRRGSFATYGVGLLYPVGGSELLSGDEHQDEGVPCAFGVNVVGGGK